MVPNKKWRGVFRWLEFAALQQKSEGGGGTIKLKRRTIKLKRRTIKLKRRTIKLFLKRGI